MNKKDNAKHNPMKSSQHNSDGTVIYEYEDGLRLKYDWHTGNVTEVDEYGNEITEDD